MIKIYVDEIIQEYTNLRFIRFSTSSPWCEWGSVIDLPEEIAKDFPKFFLTCKQIEVLFIGKKHLLDELQIPEHYRVEIP